MGDEVETGKVCSEVFRMLPNDYADIRKNESIAFLSTAFGFGPASKAATIAAEFRRTVPGVELDFFGSGIDFDFAVKAGVFDHVLRYDVDEELSLEELAKYLQAYDQVVSVLNFKILRWWHPTYPPLHIVDSLTWMWPTMPANLERSAHYFVQNYLLPRDRVKEWGKSVRVVTTGPICDGDALLAVCRNDKKLLINFSGCSNPILNDKVYHNYVSLLSSIILDVCGKYFNRVVICTREDLHPVIRECVGARAGVSVVHLPRDRFLSEMCDCGALLTSPGITTTLEALRFGTPIGFLLPQNYSQYLLSEHNARTFGQQRCMAMSRFGAQYHVPEGLPAVDGVAAVAKNLEDILKNHTTKLTVMVREMLMALRGFDKVEISDPAISEERGQELIVRTIMASMSSAERQFKKGM